MIRTALCFVLALLATAGYAQTDVRTKVLDIKPGLDKHVTLLMRAASLREILDKVEAETKVRLRPDREIAEDKCTVWVKDKPARDVLKAIAKCFNLGWAEAEIGELRYLNLYMDRKSQAAMSKRLYDDYAVVLGQFDKEVRTTVDALRSKAEITFPTPGSIPNDEYDRLVYRDVYAHDNQLGSMAVQYLNLTVTQKKTLFDGKEVHVSADLICKESSELYPEISGYTFWVERSLAGYMLQGSVQPRIPENEWQMIEVALFDDTRYDKLIATECDALAKDEKLAKQITLPKVEPTPPPPADAATQAAADPYQMLMQPVPKPYEGSGATPRTMSDALLTIAEAADMPLVAQYLSEYSPPNTPPPVSGKLCDLLTAQCKLHKFTIARDGDILQARAVLWHRLHDREVPEKTIKRWQRATAGLLYPAFETYVEMAGATWGQIRGIIGNYAYWFGAPEPPRLAWAEYVCKLYSSLTTIQQRALWDGQSIPVSTLRTDQQHLFMQAFEHKARPSYVKAQDPGWRTKAFLKLRRSYSGQIFAFANGRILGIEATPQERIQQTAPDGSVWFAPMQDLTPDSVSKTTAKLLDSTTLKHPEIPRKSIAVYQLGQIYLDTFIGEDTDSTDVPCLQRLN